MNCMYRTLLAAVALAISSVTASAETITVCADGCDYTSINAAIGAASDGDVIQLAAETYFEGEQIDTLGKAITLRGVLNKAGDPATVLDGAGTHRVLICQRGETSSTVLEDLLVRNGDANNDGGGGIFINASSPVLRGCAFTGNTSYVGGGGLLVQSNALLDGCDFESNTGGYGGGLRLVDSNAVITFGVFTENLAQYGGGLDVFGLGGTNQLDNCTFVANSSDIQGGGIRVDASGLRAVSCVINENGTGGTGGGVYVNNSEVSLQHCEIRSNQCEFKGGGIWSYLNPSYPGGGSLIALENCTLCDNQSGQIFGGWSDAGGNCVAASCVDADDDGVPDQCDRSSPRTLHVPEDFSTIEEAVSHASIGDTVLIGAGTYQLQAPLVLNGLAGITGAVSDANQPATVIEGAGFIRLLEFESSSTTLTSIQNIIFRNGAGAAVEIDGGTLGGAAIVWAAMVDFFNCRFEQNEADYGGAVYLRQGSNVRFFDCDFRNNAALHTGGALRINESNVVLDGVNVSGNSAVVRGGGIACLGTGSTRLSNSQVIDCSSSYGGAIYGISTALILEESEVANCSAEYGGGVRADSCSLSVRSLLFNGNFASRDGGVFSLHSNSQLSVIDSEFLGSTAGRYGGAIDNRQGSHSQVVNSSFTNGHADSGGGIYSDTFLQLDIQETEFDACCQVVPLPQPNQEPGNDFGWPCDPCVGDTDCNGIVNSADLGRLLSAWNTSRARYDLAEDGIVDAADLGRLLGSWGPCR